jgi:hypothetical protein
MSLQDVIKQVRNDEGNRGEWLLIQGDAADLNLATDCALSRVEIDENSSDLREIIPPEYLKRGFRSTIDHETVRDCIRWADRLSGRQDDEAAAEIIRYYIRFDAWPETLGAPDPPPPEEIIKRLDREFYAALGPEQPGTQCRHEGCGRGTTRFSVFCRVHQFEQVKKKPCPFQH